jgi:hypothetical protein
MVWIKTCRRERETKYLGREMREMVEGTAKGNRILFST